MSYYYLNRTLCDVLDEMRKLHESRNYSSMLGLIEEAQSMANRMEAKLNDVKDCDRLRKDIKKLRDEIKVLEDKKEKLEEKND